MKTIISLLAIVSVAFGAYFFIDNRYALSQEMKQIERRLDYKIVSDQLEYKDSRIDKIEKSYPDQSKMPPIVQEEHKKLKKDKAVLEKKLEVLEKK
jgi:hypothetical protein